MIIENGLIESKLKAWLERVGLLEGKKERSENIIIKIIDIIYPQTCTICGKLNQKSLCNKCKIR